MKFRIYQGHGYFLPRFTTKDFPLLNQGTANVLSATPMRIHARVAFSLLLQPVHFSALVVIATTVAIGFATSWLIVIGFWSAVIGTLSVLTFVILIAPNHYLGSSVLPDRVVYFQKYIKDLGVTLHSTEDSYNLPVIVNRSVSTTLQNLLDLIFRDILESSLRDIIQLKTSKISAVKNDIWEALYNFYTHISNIDPVQFVTHDVVVRVTQHLKKIRLATTTPDTTREKAFAFLLSSFLQTTKTELDFLRKLADAMIVNLLPKPYGNCFLVRHALGEIIACQVLQPGIDALCDPDNINQHLLLQLRVQQMMKKNYAYAASYEDLVDLIETCEDHNELTQLRDNIVTEIAQATAVSTVKRTKCVEFEQDYAPLGPSKMDLLQERNLKRYIKQLTYARIQCERRLRLLGAPINDVPKNITSVSNCGDDMVPSFKQVMRNNNLRQQLEYYLNQQGESQAGLLKFWIGTQDLRRLDRKAALESAAKLFFTYVNANNPIVKFEKSLLKGMEGFITGDKGPEAFFQACDVVWKILEERYYPSFLVVLTCQMTGRQSCTSDIAPDALKDRNSSWMADDSEDNSGVIEWSEQTQMAKSRIEHLDGKLIVKHQAMNSLRNVAPSDNSLTSAVEKEVESLQAERREVENWLNQAESWAAHVGHWKAAVGLPPQASEDKDNTRFPIELHLENEAIITRKRVPMSWTVWRQVAEFYELHSKLSLTCPWLKSTQLPAISSKSLFGKLNDRIYLERAQDKLQSFLDTVMADDRLNKSEALFSFLHTTPNCLRQVPADAPKKTNRFFFSTLFKGDTPRESEDDVDQQQLPQQQQQQYESNSTAAMSCEETDSPGAAAFSDDARDGIAEPIYDLISEIFDLERGFGWLRKTLITFVQITYGRTINRQLRDVITGLFTDQAIIGYVQLLVKTWWPDGSLLPAPPPRSVEEKRCTKMEARALLVDNIPDVLNQLLGVKNVQRGALRIFDALQDERLNKQLFYDLLEVILQDGFPEIAGSQQQAQ